MNKEKYQDHTAERAIHNAVKHEQNKKRAEQKACNTISLMVRNGLTRKEIVSILNNAYKKIKSVDTF